MDDITPLADSNEIKCPHCGTVFTIDEAQYADIAQQVRTVEFEKEIHSRLAEAANYRTAGRVDQALTLKAEALALADRLDAFAAE